MSRRRVPTRNVEPVSEVDEPPDSGGESPFEAAQELLAAALDEVRLSGSGDSAAATSEASSAVRTASPRPTRRRSRATPATPARPVNETGADQSAQPDVRRSRRARPRVVTRTEVESDESPIRALEDQAEAIRRRSNPPAGELALTSSLVELDEQDDEDDVDEYEDAVALQPLPDDDATIPDVPMVALAAATSTVDRSTGRQSARRVGAREGSRSRGALWLSVVGVLAVVVIAGATIVSTSGGGETDGSAEPSGRGAAAPRLAFSPVTTPDGAVVERVWALQGQKGDRFVGTISFSNPTSAPLEVSHTEVIPKSLASSVDDIRFEPEPTIVEADPVVEYKLTVPPKERVTARFEISVRAVGARRARLLAWADAADRASESSATTTTTSTTSTTLAPTTTAAPPTTVLALPGPPPPPPPPPTPTGTGAVVIRAVAQGGGGQFGYSGTGGSASLATGSGGASQSSAIPVGAGVISWTQVSAPPGSALLGVSCSSGASVSGATATFEVHPGETVVCTWTNG